ncbi:pyroglutamyl-peptidase I [Babesia caballi]|uniref:Pyroglutamyl-peptidase I n=1 Tax=Babesia caballi TaxID=5871 RepID=A0AAV4M4A9_BABCB|nr:pyroglutamyl-peptidase I [Babesia caballi]
MESHLAVVEAGEVDQRQILSVGLDPGAHLARSDVDPAPVLLPEHRSGQRLLGLEVDEVHAAERLLHGAGACGADVVAEANAGAEVATTVADGHNHAQKIHAALLGHGAHAPPLEDAGPQVLKLQGGVDSFAGAHVIVALRIELRAGGNLVVYAAIGHGARADVCLELQFLLDHAVEDAVVAPDRLAAGDRAKLASVGGDNGLQVAL